MTTNAYRMILASATLAAASALAGCDAGQDPEPYADSERNRAADESTYAAEERTDARDPASMDQSLASDRLETSPRDPGTMQDPATSMAGQLTEAEVVGQPVVTEGGEEVGTIVQVVDDANGGGRFAVVDVGEFLGIGQKQVAIDVRHLSLGADGQIRSNVTADQLQSMPEYEGPESGQQEMEEEDAE